jgi:hypothetical protein
MMIEPSTAGRLEERATMPSRLFEDTSPEAEARLLEICRKMPVWRKVQLVDDANRTACALAMAGLRQRHPGESLQTLRRRLLGLLLGEDLASRVYGPLEKAP